MRCSALARLLSTILVALTTTPHLASAQGALGASGFSTVRTTHSVAPFEHVDPFSGNLLLTFTDLELPGNAGFNLRVQRTYNSKIHLDFQENTGYFKQRTWVGLGWSLHFGRVLHADSTAPGETVIEMSDGSGHPLYNGLSSDPDYGLGSSVTSELWRYNRATSTLKLPNGLTYIFGQVGIGGGPDGQVRYVTEINDQYGNKLLFDYFTGSGGTHPGPTDGVRRIRQLLGDITREVTFTVTSLAYGYALATMNYGTRTWTYTHTEPSGWPTNHLLMSTSGPVAGTTWNFAYSTSWPGPELLTVTGPFGGVLGYTYTNTNRPVWDEIVTTRSIATRTTGGPRITAGSWSFAYTEGPCQDTAVVTGPTRRETYRFRGVGRTSSTPGCTKPQVMEEFAVNRPGFIGGLFPREDGAHVYRKAVRPRAA